MLLVLSSLDIRQKSRTELKALVAASERALLAGTSTEQDMINLIEAEKELLRREHRETKRSIKSAQKTYMTKFSTIQEDLIKLPEA